MPTLYRVENPDTNIGLWYNEEGRKTDFIVHEIPNALNRDLPMEFDPDFAGGWVSAAESLSQMKLWVSKDDMVNLAKRGYRLFKIDVPEYRVGEAGGVKHALFRKDKALYTPIPMDFIALAEDDVRRNIVSPSPSGLFVP